jgi:hypothetical protein
MKLAQKQLYLFLKSLLKKTVNKSEARPFKGSKGNSNDGS